MDIRQILSIVLHSCGLLVSPKNCIFIEFHFINFITKTLCIKVAYFVFIICHNQDFK